MQEQAVSMSGRVVIGMDRHQGSVTIEAWPPFTSWAGRTVNYGLNTTLIVPSAFFWKFA
jgi:hypothetical protein